MTQTLVTGGSGFIGQHLVAALLAQGCRVRVLDLRPPSYVGAGAQYVKGSIFHAQLVHEALDDVAEVYHLAALPGMWTRCKKDFHAVNDRGTEIVLEAARQRGVSRFLHCSTESILFGSSPLESFAIDHVGTTPNEMPGVYTRSKLAAEQRALQAAASGFPVVIANPTMPIGPHYGNLTPPTLMLRYFINRRIQLYFDFVLNLVDVRDVAAGLLLAMERGQSGHRYILGGEAISLGKSTKCCRSNHRSQSFARSDPGGDRSHDGRSHGIRVGSCNASAAGRNSGGSAHCVTLLIPID